MDTKAEEGLTYYHNPNKEALVLSDYEFENNNPESPIRFLCNKNNPNDRLVKIGREIVPVLPKPEDPELLEHWWDWKEIEKMVCFDQPTLNLLEEVASRYNRRQSLTVEGVPAVTKTFGIWVFAVLIGSPYYRVNMTPNSKDRAI